MPFPPPDLPAQAATADLDELWRGIAIILAWALKRYGPRINDRLLAFVVKHGGAVVSLPLTGQSMAPAVTPEWAVIDKTTITT